MRKTLLLLTLLLCFTAAFAQRERNYVYVLDCTQSMRGYNGAPDIWASTLSFLQKDIEGLPSSTSVSVIPFQTQVYPDISFLRSEFNDKKWGQIQSTLEGYLNGPLSNTNICDAWVTSERFIDPHRDNYIILLTDGEDNVKKVPALVRLLEDWCGKYKNTEGFYVKLTSAAVNENLKRAIDHCQHLTDVDATRGITPFGKFLMQHLTVNTLELPKRFKIQFSTMGTYHARIVDNTTPLNLQVVNDQIENGAMILEVSSPYATVAELNEALDGCPDVMPFALEVDAAKLNLSDGAFDITIVRKEERVLTLANATENQVALDKATYYPAWCFASESDPDTLRFDLGAALSNQARQDGSRVSFKVVDEDHPQDYTVLFNEVALENNIFTVDRQTEQAVVAIVFRKDAQQGTRYFRIQPMRSVELDRINDDAPSAFDFTLKTGYDVQWNPLKLFCFWLGLLLLAALVVWFLFLKPMLYPGIKVGTLTISEPYFSSVRVKGARAVVFTNRKRNQGFLSRLFTGRILYQVHETWTSPLTFEANKKGLRAISGGKYLIDPYTSRLERMNDYTVVNNETGTKIALRIN